MRVKMSRPLTRLDAEQEVPADAAEGARWGCRSSGSIRSWWNSLGGWPEQARDQRREERDQDQEDHDDAAGQRELVALQARPGDLAERTALDPTALTSAPPRHRPSGSGRFRARCRAMVPSSWLGTPLGRRWPAHDPPLWRRWFTTRGTVLSGRGVRVERGAHRSRYPLVRESSSVSRSPARPAGEWMRNRDARQRGSVIRTSCARLSGNARAAHRREFGRCRTVRHRQFSAPYAGDTSSARRRPRRRVRTASPARRLGTRRRGRR